MKPLLTAFLLLTPLFAGAQDAPAWTPTPTPSSGTIVAQILVDGLWAPPGCSWDPIQGLCIGLDGSCPTDLDGNGATGAADLLIFLSNYNLFCND